MFFICKKEITQFLGNPVGYLVIGIFLLLNALLLFVFPDTSLLTFGYATLQPFFDVVPWVLLFFIPAITMKSFAEEYKTGSFEILKTLPLTSAQIVLGKFLSGVFIVLLTLLLTSIFAITVQILSTGNGIDLGATIASYFGLLLLCSSFLAIGIYISSLTSNVILAFVGAAFACFIFFIGIESLSKLSFLKGSFDYFIEYFGLNTHYIAMSKGAIYFKDILYFNLVCMLFLFLAIRNVKNK